MKPQRFGDYTLLDRLGHGGMGEIFLARPCGQAGLERLVAIKRIHGRVTRNSKALVQFIDEANIAARMGHSNIAQIFDFGDVDGQCYIAMEHIHGRDLSAIFRAYQKRGPVPGQKAGRAMPMAYACHVVMKLCEALDYAHKRKDFCGRPLGFVHRDVSLRNLMLSFDGELKLIDFGIAKAVCRIAATEQSAVRGTPAYMSPEQVGGQPVDHRSDVFACGIALFELLTGQRLFQCRDIPELIRRITKVDIPSPRACNPAIPEELEAIILKALQRDPVDRYQTALAFFDALLDFVQRADLYVTRSQVSDWMKTLFREEYEADSRRIAALWSHAWEAPMPCNGERSAGRRPRAAPGRSVHGRILHDHDDLVPMPGILSDPADPTGERVHRDGRVQRRMSARDTERGWMPAPTLLADPRVTDPTCVLPSDTTHTGALGRATRRDDRGADHPDVRRDRRVDLDDLDETQPTRSCVIMSAAQQSKPAPLTEAATGERRPGSRLLGGTVLLALTRWLAATVVVLAVLL